MSCRCLAVLIGLSSLVFACAAETANDEQPSEPAGEESDLVRRAITIDADDNNKTVAVSQNQRFTLKLAISGVENQWFIKSNAFGEAQRWAGSTVEYIGWNTGNKTGSHVIELVYAKTARATPVKRFKVTIDIKTAVSGKCGGLVGLRCSASEWCNFTGSVCGRFDRMGTCNPRPDACPQNAQPVCGCNFKTYANACLARVAGVDVMAQGSCAD